MAPDGMGLIEYTVVKVLQVNETSLIFIFHQ